MHLSYIIEIEKLRSTIDYLIEEVHDLKAQSSQSQTSKRSSSTIRSASFSPEPLGGYKLTRSRLEKMTDEQFKSFRVIMIYDLVICTDFIIYSLLTELMYLY